MFQIPQVYQSHTGTPVFGVGGGEGGGLQGAEIFNTSSTKYFTHNSNLEMEMFGSKPSVVLKQSLPTSIKQGIFISKGNTRSRENSNDFYLLILNCQGFVRKMTQNL